MTILPIKLPKEGTPLVKTGDKIKKGQLIAQIAAEDNEVIHFSSYNISSKNFPSYIKKHLGDKILEGEVIAIKKKFVGGLKIRSPFSGTLVKIDEEKQDLYIKPTDLKEKLDLLSPVEGTVEFCDNTKILIKTDALALTAKDILGDSIVGEVLVDSSQSLDSRIEGKIVVRDSFDKLSVFKAFGLGALGIVTKDLADFDFLAIGNDFRNTIVTVGEDDYKKLEKSNGKNIHIERDSKLIIL